MNFTKSREEFVVEVLPVADLPHRVCGIYFARNLKDNKGYVGSSVCVRARMRAHLSGRGRSRIARAVKKHGRHNFVFWLLEECQRSELLVKEAEWMRRLPTDYNCIALVENGRKEYSEEHKQRITAHFKGKKLTEEHKEKIRAALKGVPLSPERRFKIGQARKGKKLSLECRRKLSEMRKGRRAWNKGIPHTEEHKRKISLAGRGKPAWNKGIPHTTEHKNKIKEAIKRRTTNGKSNDN